MENNSDADATFNEGKMFPRVLNLSFGAHTKVSIGEDCVDVVITDYGPLRKLFNRDTFVIIKIHQALHEFPGEMTKRLLVECRRILHPEGELHVTLPDSADKLGNIYWSNGVELPQSDDSSEVIGALSHLFREAGFEKVQQVDAFVDMNSHYLENELQTGEKSISVVASRNKQPHSYELPISDHYFYEKIREFKKKYPHPPAVSFIITVYNEARSLPHFLSFFENIKDETCMDREFIFVVNGCTDDSEDILRRFVTESSVKAKVITSEKGIVPAFKEGVKRRDLNGFVGRFDADIFLHPHTLDLMQMHLVMNEKAIVTYAEPMAMDAPSIYNEPWYNPGVISKRLYFTGKTCLYRTSPYSYDAIRNMPQEFVADDIFPSFYFTYYYGLNSISRTPFAVVYEKVVSTFEDLVHQQSRCDSEIQRIIQRCQYLLNLNNVTVQEIYPGPYKNLMDRAKSKAVYVDDWIRVESTK